MRGESLGTRLDKKSSANWSRQHSEKHLSHKYWTGEKMLPPPGPLLVAKTKTVSPPSSPLLADQKWTHLAKSSLVKGWSTLGKIQLSKSGLVHFWQADLRVEQVRLRLDWQSAMEYFQWDASQWFLQAGTTFCTTHLFIYKMPTPNAWVLLDQMPPFLLFPPPPKTPNKQK